jgi:tyrosyl-tRNA synthetase
LVGLGLGRAAQSTERQVLAGRAYFLRGGIRLSRRDGDGARADFEAKFSKKDLSSAEMEPFRPSTAQLSVAKLVQETKAIASNSEARRLITQGGVKLDGAKLPDPQAEVTLTSGQVLQVGKKTFFRIQL